MADEAGNEDSLIEAEPKKGSGISLPMLALTVLIAVGASAGSAMFVVKSIKTDTPPAAVDAGAEDGAVAVGEDPLFLSLDPAFTVNLADRDLMRYLQAEIQVMTHDKDVLDRIEKRMPMVRNRLLLMLGTQTYEKLSTAEGKAEIQTLARKEISAALGVKPESSGIDAVLFTSLVVQ